MSCLLALIPEDVYFDILDFCGTSVLYNGIVNRDLHSIHVSWDRLNCKASTKTIYDEELDIYDRCRNKALRYRHYFIYQNSWFRKFASPSYLRTIDFYCGEDSLAAPSGKILYKCTAYGVQVYILFKTIDAVPFLLSNIPCYYKFTTQSSGGVMSIEIDKYIYHLDINSISTCPYCIVKASADCTFCTSTVMFRPFTINEILNDEFSSNSLDKDIEDNIFRST